MSTNDLLSYLGALMGAGAFVVSVLAYRKTGSIKSLEVRLELKKISVATFAKADGLGELLAQAGRSRDAVAAATGKYQSGAHAQWKQQLAADIEAVEGFRTTVAELNVDYSKSTLAQLEKATEAMHAFKLLVDGMSDKYLSSMAEDDEARRSLRDQAQARFARSAN